MATFIQGAMFIVFVKCSGLYFSIYPSNHHLEFWANPKQNCPELGTICHILLFHINEQVVCKKWKRIQPTVLLFFYILNRKIPPLFPFFHLTNSKKSRVQGLSSIFEVNSERKSTKSQNSTSNVLWTQRPQMISKFLTRKRLCSSLPRPDVPSLYSEFLAAFLIDKTHKTMTKLSIFIFRISADRPRRLPGSKLGRWGVACCSRWQDLRRL